MPTFIKTGFWEKARKGYNEWLNLDQLITNIVTSLIPPAPTYKVYTALLTQTGTNPPVATVLENTLGDVVWSYVSPGKYRANLSGAFTEGKTFLSENYENTFYILKIININFIAYSTYVTATDTLENGLLLDTPIEIRVYN
jgi:hypothetical protein